MDKIRTLEEAVEQLDNIRIQLKGLLKELKDKEQQKPETQAKSGVIYYSPKISACDTCPYAFKQWRVDRMKATRCELIDRKNRPVGCMGELFRYNIM